MNDNLYSHLLGDVADADRKAVEDVSGAVFSYGDLIRLSAQFANVLAQSGVKAGDRVAVQVEKSTSALILYLAALRVGAIYLPLNTAYTLAELDYFLGDSEPRLFVCDPKRQADAEAIARRAGASILTLDAEGRGSLWDAAQVSSPVFSTVERKASDIAAILYTSGTTGRSKGAMLTHGNLLSNARTLCKVWRFEEHDVLVHALPIFHTHGLFVAINVCLVSRASMIFLPKIDPEQIMAVLRRATVLMGVPTFYTRLLQSPALSVESCASMRLFISGSAPLLAETHNEWREKTGHAILERYGMTETNMNTSNPYDGERVPGTVGFPLPGVDLRITDMSSGEELPRNEIGMIEVRGPNVFLGYWRMPEKTASEFREDGFFITGDVGIIDPAGYVHISGRSKDLVITGGYNVYPKEVETEINLLPGVVECAVFGVKHDDLGEGVTAMVVVQEGARLSEAEVLKHLEQRLAAYKRPKRIFFASELPRNTMGKVQKNLLRERHADIYRRTTAATTS